MVDILPIHWTILFCEIKGCLVLFANPPCTIPYAMLDCIKHTFRESVSDIPYNKKVRTYF